MRRAFLFTGASAWPPLANKRLGDSDYKPQLEKALADKVRVPACACSHMTPQLSAAPPHAQAEKAEQQKKSDIARLVADLKVSGEGGGDAIPQSALDRMMDTANDEEDDDDDDAEIIDRSASLRSARSSARSQLLTRPFHRRTDRLLRLARGRATSRTATSWCIITKRSCWRGRYIVA